MNQVEKVTLNAGMSQPYKGGVVDGKGFHGLNGSGQEGTVDVNSLYPARAVTGSEYIVELARAWRAYPGKHILSFYQFAVIFKAGWDAKQ
jgi:L-rhamnose isomerase